MINLHVFLQHFLHCIVSLCFKAVAEIAGEPRRRSPAVSFVALMVCLWQGSKSIWDGCDAGTRDPIRHGKYLDLEETFSLSVEFGYVFVEIQVLALVFVLPQWNKLKDFFLDHELAHHF